MICPKCGFSQPDSDSCVRCGVRVDEYRDHVSRLRDPANAIRGIVTSYASRLRSDRVFFAPDIPDKFISNALGKHKAENLPGKDEEILFLADDTVISRDAEYHTILTTSRIISSYMSKTEICEYSKVKSARIGGSMYNTLFVNGVDYSCGFLARLAREQRDIFLKMLLEIVGFSKSVASASARAVPEKPEHAESSAPVSEARVEAPVPEPMTQIQDNGVSLPPPVPRADERYATPRVPARGQTQGSASSTGASVTKGFGGPAGSAKGKDLSAGIVGFLAGGFLGIPLGIFIGSIAGLSGDGPWYLGLLTGAVVWSITSAYIRSRRAAKS